jgi:hypothetical protein
MRCWIYVRRGERAACLMWSRKLLCYGQQLAERVRPMRARILWCDGRAVISNVQRHVLSWVLLHSGVFDAYTICVWCGVVLRGRRVSSGKMSAWFIRRITDYVIRIMQRRVQRRVLLPPGLKRVYICSVWFGVVLHRWRHIFKSMRCRLLRQHRHIVNITLYWGMFVRPRELLWDRERVLDWCRLSHGLVLRGGQLTASGVRIRGFLVSAGVLCTNDYIVCGGLVWAGGRCGLVHIGLVCGAMCVLSGQLLPGW